MHTHIKPGFASCVKSILQHYLKVAGKKIKESSSTAAAPQSKEAVGPAPISTKTRPPWQGTSAG